MFPAVLGVAAELPPTAEALAGEPPTAAEPLSLLRRLHFKMVKMSETPCRLKINFFSVILIIKTKFK